MLCNKLNIVENKAYPFPVIDSWGEHSNAMVPFLLLMWYNVAKSKQISTNNNQKFIRDHIISEQRRSPTPEEDI